MFSANLRNLAMLILDDAEKSRLRICAAESCTGGLLSALFTDIPGSSAAFERGFIVYSNKAKEEMLGVAGDVIADYGAVSEPVVRMMAEGALANSRANIAVAITGVAGPGGGTAMKPVGTVYVACARENRAMIHERLQVGDIGREKVRLAAIECALQQIQAQMR